MSSCLSAFVLNTAAWCRVFVDGAAFISPYALSNLPGRLRCSKVAAAWLQQAPTAQEQEASRWIASFSRHRAMIVSSWWPDRSITEAVISISPVSKASMRQLRTCLARAILYPAARQELEKEDFQSAKARKFSTESRLSPLSVIISFAAARYRSFVSELATFQERFFLRWHLGIWSFGWIFRCFFGVFDLHMIVFGYVLHY